MSDDRACWLLGWYAVGVGGGVREYGGVGCGVRVGMSAPKHRKAQPRHILATRVAELRAEGLNGVQIAERLQISTTYACALIHDPTGEQDRERKQQTQYGFCRDCGARTSYGRNGISEQCFSCSVDDRTVWTQDGIVCAIQEWADEHGGIPPAACDWMAPAEIRGPFPSVNCVQGRFGSWNAAIVAAGYEPHHPGPVGGFTALTAAQREECARRYAAGESSTVIAADLGCRPNIVIKWASRAGVPIRDGAIRRAAA